MYVENCGRAKLVIKLQDIRSCDCRVRCHMTKGSQILNEGQGDKKNCT